tara:strand:+ start:292 stop:762 length:471 start_codon:yes stop_codon:yes gene_type:complete
MERISIYNIKYTTQIIKYPSKEFNKYRVKIMELFKLREPSKSLDFKILGKCKILLLKNEISNMIYGFIIMHDFGRKYNLFMYHMIGNPKYKNVNVPLFFKFFDYASNQGYLNALAVLPMERKWIKYIFKREGYKKTKFYKKNKKYSVYKKRIYHIV